MRLCKIIVCFVLIFGLHGCEAIQCYDYNKTSCLGGVDDCPEYETVKECPLKNMCFVLWSNSTNGIQSVNMKGCFIENRDCKNAKCVGKGSQPKNNMLFCCCNADLCNGEFSWEPTTPPPSPPPLKETDNSEYKGKIMYLICLIFALSISVLVFVTIFWKKKKLPYFHQIESFDQPHSPLTPIQEKHRQIDIIEKKASGKFGDVHKAYDYDQKKIVAVKIIPAHEKQSWLTEQETYKLPCMNHVNILRFIAAEKRNELWIITDFHDNGSLCDYLKSNTISWEQLCHIALTMMRGLAHLHQETWTKEKFHKPAVAHRDFKSSNVLLKNDLGACIADFGLALIFHPSTLCGDTHGQVGTRRYMAPEILEGAIDFSRDSFLRIDTYAAGLVLWELLSRCNLHQDIVSEYKLPFEAEIGSHPSLEDMQELVVHRKQRPVIGKSWRQHSGLMVFCDTIEELWDHDAEARISACCVTKRIESLLVPAPTVSTPLMQDSFTSNTFSAV